jgi:hypothetical protein
LEGNQCSTTVQLVEASQVKSSRVELNSEWKHERCARGNACCCFHDWWPTRAVLFSESQTQREVRRPKMLIKISVAGTCLERSIFIRRTAKLNVVCFLLFCY